MATYFHGAPEFQTDGLQTLYLMNPGYDGYSDAVAPANIVFLNSAMNSLNSVNLSHTTQQNQQESLVGIPFQATGPSPESNRPSSAHSSHDIRAFHGLVHGLNSNLWMQMPQSNSVDISSQLGLRRPLVVPPAQQGLSLSLSSEQPYTRYQPESENSAILKEISPASAEEARISGSSSSVSVVSNGISGLQSVLTSSKYLKAAQELLDEVVHVEKGIEGELHKGISSKTLLKMNGDVEGMGGFEVNGKLGAELTTAERQELQIKKTKLVSMVDEVEQRYRQYQYHMQIVVSYFEAAAGLRSARTYTALALQTISKQFRCLRDAISGRIRATSKSLGEEDSMIRGTKSEGSRLRFVDHHLRQQRALQQLGMIQHNAWRPQRGLPERAVSVLRAWLFEHFLHPYPRDSDKHMLAKQTGLTRSQVSNWFINARVRLWKPMVEEMYSEEIKEQEQNDADDKLSQSGTTDLVPKSSAPQENSPTRTEQSDSFKPKQDYLNDSKPLTIADPTPDSGKGWNQGSYHDSEARMQVMLKKARNEDSQHLNSMPHSMSVNNNSDDTNNGELVMKSGDGSGFGAYSIGEIARFDPEQFSHRFSGNGVSLTLGLPHCDSLSLSGTHPSYISSESIPLGRRLEMSTENNDYWSLNNNPSVAHSSTAYESIRIQNRKRVSENYYQS